MCEQAAEEKIQAEIDALQRKQKGQLDTLETRLSREENRLESYKDQLGHRRVEELGKGVENVLGMFTSSRRTVSTSLTKRRMTSQAKANVDKSQLEIKNIQRDIEQLKAEQADDLARVNQKWADALDQVVEEPVSAFKKDIYIERFGLVWLPFYAFEKGDDWVTVPAFRWGAR